MFCLFGVALGSIYCLNVTQIESGTDKITTKWCFMPLWLLQILLCICHVNKTSSFKRFFPLLCLDVAQITNETDKQPIIALYISGGFGVMIFIEEGGSDLHGYTQILSYSIGWFGPIGGNLECLSDTWIPLGIVFGVSRILVLFYLFGVFWMEKMNSELLT